MVALRERALEEPLEETADVIEQPADTLRDRRLAELAALEVAGRLQPEAVVRAAKSPTSALHSWFEWDDAKAAHAYRLDQARTLIASFSLSVTRKDITVTAVAYVRDPDAGPREQGYRGTAAVATRSEWATAALDAELARVAAMVQRCRSVAAAVGLADVAEQRLRALLG